MDSIKARARHPRRCTSKTTASTALSSESESESTPTKEAETFDCQLCEWSTVDRSCAFYWAWKHALGHSKIHQSSCSACEFTTTFECRMAAHIKESHANEAQANEIDLTEHLPVLREMAIKCFPNLKARFQDYDGKTQYKSANFHKRKRLEMALEAPEEVIAKCAKCDTAFPPDPDKIRSQQWRAFHHVRNKHLLTKFDCSECDFSVTGFVGKMRMAAYQHRVKKHKARGETIITSLREIADVAAECFPQFTFIDFAVPSEARATHLKKRIRKSTKLNKNIDDPTENDESDGEPTHREDPIDEEPAPKKKAFVKRMKQAKLSFNKESVDKSQQESEPHTNEAMTQTIATKVELAEIKQDGEAEIKIEETHIYCTMCNKNIPPATKGSRSQERRALQHVNTKHVLTKYECSECDFTVTGFVGKTQMLAYRHRVKMHKAQGRTISTPLSEIAVIAAKCFPGFTFRNSKRSMKVDTTHFEETQSTSSGLNQNNVGTEENHGSALGAVPVDSQPLTGNAMAVEPVKERKPDRLPIGEYVDNSQHEPQLDANQITLQITPTNCTVKQEIPDVEADGSKSYKDELKERLNLLETRIRSIGEQIQIEKEKIEACLDDKSLLEARKNLLDKNDELNKKREDLEEGRNNIQEVLRLLIARQEALEIDLKNEEERTNELEKERLEHYLKHGKLLLELEDLEKKSNDLQARIQNL